MTDEIDFIATTRSEFVTVKTIKNLTGLIYNTGNPILVLSDELTIMTKKTENLPI